MHRLCTLPAHASVAWLSDRQFQHQASWIVREPRNLFLRILYFRLVGHQSFLLAEFVRHPRKRDLEKSNKVLAG
jgi:hypothetical protein